ncbi:hypothetical protein JL_188 [Bacillus phage JL]|uniref:Uncharacterized protein n=1 Tax=Bacillus phage JL TaxID=1296655 RepID=S5M4Q1_9CAUD|nr:hypothetical protein AVV47_gp108 [Bacillus phage JL]AGR46856.1 hypothetical protein JL_188 [Bacillus phage JL]
MKTEIADKIIEAPEGVKEQNQAVERVMNRLPLHKVPHDKMFPRVNGLRTFNGDAWVEFGIERYERLIPLTRKSRIKRRMKRDLNFMKKYREDRVGRQH